MATSAATTRYQTPHRTRVCRSTFVWSQSSCTAVWTRSLLDRRRRRRESYGRTPCMAPPLMDRWNSLERNEGLRVRAKICSFLKSTCPKTSMGTKDYQVVLVVAKASKRAFALGATRTYNLGRLVDQVDRSRARKAGDGAPSIRRSPPMVPVRVLVHHRRDRSRAPRVYSHSPLRSIV